MFLYILIFISWCIAIVVNYKNSRTFFKSNNHWTVLVGQILSWGIIFPIMEESIFRHTLPFYMAHFKYHQYINALLFGSSHAANIIVYDPITVAFQVISTTILGYYFINLNNLLNAMLYHILYNSSIMIIAFVYFKWTFKKSKSVKPIYTFFSDPNNEYYYKQIHSLKRSKSTGDLVSSTNRYQTIKLSLNKEKNKDLIEKIKKFDNINN